MKIILQKITIISACLGLAFFIFAPGVRAAGCCQIYYKLDKKCDQHKDLMTAIKNSSPGLSDMEVTCLINNFPEIEASDTGDSLKDKLISKIQENLQDVYQVYEEVGTDYLEWFGGLTWMLGSEHYNCVDGYINDCRIEADTRGVITFWSTKACDPTECEEYNPATNIPAIQPTNPVCWPQAECEAVCKTGSCWTGQADECSPGRGYCLADQTDIELGVNIAGVGRVSDFGSYIALLYNYLIGVIVIVAVVMMMYGGFRWITAGGGPQIGEAKKTIASAVIGLMLGLFSYTILNIVNPATLELELPRIKRIRPIYFEVDKMRCEDYETPAECEANPNNFSITYNEEGEPSGGCVWTEIGFGKKCVSQDFTKGPGYPGNLCLPGNECNEGKCVKYENILKTYQMNPTAESTSPEQNLNWCTNGEMDMPCKDDTDCDDGFKCDERLWACVGTNKGRPLGAECDEDSQCASAFCDKFLIGSGTCKSGRGGTTCTYSTAYVHMTGQALEVEGGECNDNLGYKCVRFVEGSSSGFCCDLASAQKQGHGCYTGCTSDSQCGDDMYCWRENATLVKEGGEATEQRPIAEWSGVCFEKGGSGDYCFYDSGCKSGLSCAGYQSLSPADSAHTSLFRAPGSESSTIILPPGFDRARVGRCQ